ncbi:hypothetical protein ACFPPF_13055 [Xenophilus aerolatus]|nr:hypothetical protein [Xenophilus aerolatus]
MSRGLSLPQGLACPLDLKALHDDVHVMAFFRGHSRYESVEAMVRRRTGGHPDVRAILTLHDQSQVDHVNHEVEAGPQRVIVQRAVDFEEGEDGGIPWAQLRFLSVDGEAVVLTLRPTGPPSSERAGVSDPGTHARGNSLPLMWRGRSALASAESQVRIDGAAYPLPVLVDRRPYFVGMHGFYAEDHRMALVRAGRMSRPWTDLGDFANAEVEAQGDRVFLASLRVLASPNHSSAGLSLSFDDGRFVLALEGTSARIEGAFDSWDELNGDFRLVLRPLSPDWARARVVNVHACRQSAGWDVLTTIDG